MTCQPAASPAVKSVVVTGFEPFGGRRLAVEQIALNLADTSRVDNSQSTSFGPLPSWHDGVTKRRVVAFVESVTATDSPAFVPEAERIATFDNDGTLWTEQPLSCQLLFALDRVQTLAPDHPEWKQ